MAAHDPMNNNNNNKNDGNKIGSHLESLSHSTALTKVEENYFFSRGTLDDEQILQKMNHFELKLKDNIADYSSASELARDLDGVMNGIRSNIELLSTCLEKRDQIFRELKDDLMIQLVEKRNREEEVSFIYYHNNF